MPDHIHLLWIGLNERISDQRIALEFLRKYLRAAIAPHEWQRQAYDHVLRSEEREKGAFATVAHYILENPCRAALVAEAKQYPYSGCCVPGYPDLHVWNERYWDMFWRIYDRSVG